VTGIDIVKEQFRVAAGEELSFEQSEVDSRGVAMEFRINAEDPSEEFNPTPGTLETYRPPPTGMGVRVDDGVNEGDRISPFYDSLVGKFIVTAQDRQEVLERSKRVLEETQIEGSRRRFRFISQFSRTTCSSRATTRRNISINSSKG